MAIMNFALLALVPFVLARPQIGHGDSHKAFHVRDTTGTGLPGPFSRSSQPAQASQNAPFPVPGGNRTSGLASGSSGAPLSTGNGGPVYLTSTIDVVPKPITVQVTGSAAASAGAGKSGAGNSGSGAQQTGGSGAGNSGSGAQQTGGSGAGNSGSGAQPTGGALGSGAGAACGPAIVTITQANTVTVTVTPAGGAVQSGINGAGQSGVNGAGQSGINGAGKSGPNGAGQSSFKGAAGVSSQAPVSSPVVAPSVSSAPFPIGNGTAPAGTGTGITAPKTRSVSVAAVQATSSSVPAVQPYQATTEKKQPPQESAPQVAAPAQSSSSSAPYVAPPVPSTNAAAPPSTNAEAAPSTNAVASPSTNAAAPQPTLASSSAPQAPASSSAPAPSSSAASKAGSVGAKGVAYNTPAQAAQISGLAWACNWGQTPAVQNPSFEFVPQLWGKKPGMAESIKANAAGAKSCLFYNEPDISTDNGGSALDVGTVIADFNELMKPIQSAGTKVSTPCVSNAGSDYMKSFLSGLPSGSVDIMCFHWYGGSLEELKGTVKTFQDLASQHGISEMWINEWAVQPAPSDLSSYTSYLDGAVTRYAYNMNDMEGSTGY